jgi:uncharacterized protein (TIGR03066 family)
MRTLIGFGAALVLASGFVRGAGEKTEEKVDGKLLVGKWEPQMPKKGELASVEFTPDGKLIALADVGGKWSKSEGTYKLEGNKLTYEVMALGETTRGTVTLLKLTAEEMEGRDKEGRVDAYKRVKSK